MTRGASPEYLRQGSKLLRRKALRIDLSATDKSELRRTARNLEMLARYKIRKAQSVLSEAGFYWLVGEHRPK